MAWGAGESCIPRFCIMIGKIKTFYETSITRTGTNFRWRLFNFGSQVASGVEDNRTKAVKAAVDEKKRRGYVSPKDKRMKKAFSLVELCVVIAIVGIIAVLLIPAMDNARNKRLGKNNAPTSAPENPLLEKIYVPFLYIERVKIGDHQYLINTHGGIIHAEDCPCKKK